MISKGHSPLEFFPGHITQPLGQCAWKLDFIGMETDVKLGSGRLGSGAAACLADGVSRAPAGSALRAAVPDHRAHGSVPPGEAHDPAAVQAALRSLHARVPAVLPPRGSQGLPGEVCTAGDEDLWWVFNNNLHKSLQCRLHWWAPFLC